LKKDEPDDKDTPKWDKDEKTIWLSGADKVCLIIKFHYGSWSEQLKMTNSRREANGIQWYEDAIFGITKIMEFEKKHNIEFTELEDKTLDLDNSIGFKDKTGKVIGFVN